jgi:threonine dehydratase
VAGRDEYDRGVAVTGGSVLSLEDVERARASIGDRLHRTPLLPSATTSKRVGADVRFKAELFQRTGSFKPRGVLNKLATLTDTEKQRGVISISAGNHAQALAYASALEGIDALVVMWQTASRLKILAARGYGATVDDSAPDIPSAFERLDELVGSTGRTLIHPYDDPLVIAGQGTVGLEILEDAPTLPDVVLVQVGGGGLVSGIATAVKSLRSETRVIAVEPELSRAMHESLKAGEPVNVEPESIADGLNGPYAGANCVRICGELGVESVLVSEDALREAFRFMYARTKLACELAGAATAAALLSGVVELDGAENVVAVVSGGNVDPKTAAAILASDEG